MTIKKLIGRITQSGLVQDQQGAVLPLVGLAFVVMMLAAGFAIDYTRVQIVRERLQWAVDAATLAGAKVASSGSLAKVQSEANAYFRANFPVGYMSTRAGTPRAEWVNPVNGRGQGVRFTMNDIVMENYIMDALGLDDMQLSATAEVNTLPIKPLDVVFSVDVSGSMQVVAGKGASCTYLSGSPERYPNHCYSGGSSKLTDAKTAMRNLVSKLYSGNDTRFGVIGWSNAVNIASAIGGKYTTHKCDGNTNTIALVASENSSKVGQGNAGKTAMDSDCYWFTPGTIKGSASLRPMQYLTSNRTTINNAINNQRAEGNTDGALGTLWAYNMYRNQGWVGWKTPAKNRAIVLLTDGDNTLYYKDPVIKAAGEGADGDIYGPRDNSEQIKWCNKAKNAGINVYTIAYDIDNSIPSRVRGKKMLQNCASRVCPDNANGICYFDARNAADLARAMETIGNTMMTMRLTK